LCILSPIAEEVSNHTYRMVDGFENSNHGNRVR
jgi:hypothetical protein